MSQEKPWLVQRGRKLYDTRTNSYTITEEVSGEVVRKVPLADLPYVINRLVSVSSVLKFQSSYDGDNHRREELTNELRKASMAAEAENIRQSGFNFINSSARLQRVKRVVRQARR